MGFSNLVSKLPLRSPQDKLLHRITTRIRQSLQLQEILHVTVTEVCSLLETDRVMVYRFHPDEHGEVIAEALHNQQLPSLMGLHFPAADIPSEARALFLKSRQRSIVDLSIQQIGWSASDAFEGKADTPEDIRYRQVDSCHSEYLKAMGIQASVVVPILQQEQLWGLLVAHHSQPRTVSEAELHFLQLVVDQVTIAIAQSNLLSQVQTQAQRESTANHIATLLHCESANPFKAALEATVEAVSGSGGRLFLLPTQSSPVGNLYTCGDQPIDSTGVHAELLEQHSLWQRHGDSGDSEVVAIADLYQDDRCHSFTDMFQSTQIHSLLIIPLQQGRQTVGYLTLFRDEIDTERLWAGKFDPDERQRMPRQSFDLWRQHKTKQAQGWTEADLKLVQAIKSHFAPAVSQYQLQVQVQALNVSLEQQIQKRTKDLANIHFALGQSSLVAMTDSRGIICYVNDKFCDISQYSRDELMGQSHRIVNSGYHPKQFFSQMWQTITSGNVWRGEIKNRAKDGAAYWVDTTIVPLLDEQDNLQQCVAIQNDITNRKQAEVRLQEQEQFFRTVYEGAEHVIAIIDVLEDEEFHYVGWNPIAEKLAGIPSAAIVGKTPEALFGQADGAAVRQNYQRCVKAGTSVCYEEHLPFQGQNIWWLTTINPLKNETGRINRLVLTAVTITERKQAEEALRQKAQQEQLLNQLANQIRSSLDLDEILETAVDSIHSLLNVDRCTFVWYRPHAQPPTWECVYETKPPEFPTILGRYLSDTLGSTAERLQNLEVIQDDDTAAISDPQWRQTLLSFEFKSNLSIPMLASNGDIGVISCSHQRTRRLWKHGEVELLIAVANQLAIALNQADLYKQSRLAAETAQAKAQQLAHTLQELQHTQAKLVQTEKMSSLGQLVAGVAHEINNPVNFISGNLNHAGDYAHALLNLLHLYQQHYPQPARAIQAEADAIDLDFLQEDLPKLLTSMKVGAERIQTIVLALRNFSRMDEAEVKAVNIHDGIDSTLMILQSRIKAMAGHPEIQVLKNYGNLPLIECYAGQLNQVFMNILSNAIDALDEYNSQRSLEEQRQTPTTITIQTELVVDRSQGEQAPHREIHIRIADNGLGMTEPVRQRLFEPFFTTKPVGKGTGLGLSISYQVIVDRHGGNLSCFSAPGKGATFLIELPLAKKDKHHDAVAKMV